MMSKVTECIYLGDLEDAKRIPVMYLLDHGWSSEFNILNVATPSTPDEPRIALSCPVFKVDDEKMTVEVDKVALATALRFIDRSVRQHIKILVHCRAGVERSPYVVVRYLTDYCGLDYEDALKVVKRAHPRTLELVLQRPEYKDAKGV